MHKILLIGDNCIDKYVFGTVDRISPEAPVPVFKVDEGKETTKPGMAGNVHENLIALGNQVNFLYGKLSTKTRIIDVKSGYHLIRLDNDEMSDPFSPSLKVNYDYDAIVISDYNKGFLTYDSIRQIRELYAGPIFIDTKKKELHRFDECYVKINETELSASVSGTNEMIVTLGSKGAMYKNKLYSTKQVEVHDVTGAGDVFLASLATFYLRTGSIEKAIPYANKLASISVTYNGTYTVTKDDIDSL